MKVLIKFRLLEWQQIQRAALLQWIQATSYMQAALPSKAEVKPKFG